MKHHLNDRLYETVPYGTREAIKELLITGADPNHPLPDGKTLLIRAARWNPNPGIIHALVDHGADVNARDQSGRTALLWAAARGKTPQVLEALITLGADVTVTDHQGNTALELARQNPFLAGHPVIDRLVPPSVPVTPPGALTGTGRGYALLIGINQYAAPTLPTLKYAEKDARELGKLLQEICGFQVRCLLGQEAGFDQFQWVVEQKRLSPELPVFRAHDRFLLFFAGHGELYQGDYHLHLYHPSPHPAPSSLHLDALSNHLRHSIPCTQCMTILDACRSIAQPGMRGPSLVSSLRSRDVKTMSTSYQGKTIKTLFGCKEKGVSWEDDRYQHGVLTYHLKQALEKLRAKPAFTFEELVDQASDLMRAWGHWDNPAFRQEPYFYHVPSLERILLRG